MTGKNPFEENPWENSGPRFGNAYEDTPTPAWSGQSGTTGITKMPSPSDHISTQGWSESNKTEYTAPASPQNAWTGDHSAPTTPQNAYQFAGTRYNETDAAANDTSKTQVNSPSPPPPAGGKPRPNQAEIDAALPPVLGASSPPSKLRLLLRSLQLISAIGHLGFAAGASPYSGVDVPLSSKACFYFLFAVAILTIIWTLFHLSFYLYRRVGHGQKMNRIVMSAIDLLLAILWGVGTIVEIAKYRCEPGGYSHWCDFYNVSIFWGMLSFVFFIVAVGWDAVGSCASRRK